MLALLLLNGALPRPALVKRLARGCRALVCADGGARHAARLGLRPDFVVGDMDSLPSPLPRSWKKTLYWCDFDPERSDLEKALSFLSELGCARLYVAGALGGRLDHALVNLKVLEAFAVRTPTALLDEGLAQGLGPGKYRLALEPGTTFSLLAATKTARVTLEGARYPLSRSLLRPGSRGLSNQAVGPVALTIHSGRLWVVTPA